MATESQAPAVPDTSVRTSAIENEIPAYRAVSPGAVASLLLGLTAALTFADWWFLIAAVLAVLLGILAERKIRRFPDQFTGRALAQAGIALGLIFGVSAITIGTVNQTMANRGAAAFGREYVEVLKTKNLANAVWYRVPPTARRGMTPKQILDNMSKGAPDKAAASERIAGLKSLVERVSLPGADVHLDKIESLVIDRMTTKALAIVEVHGGKLNGKDAPEELGAIEIWAEPQDGPTGFYVHEVYFPYKPGTFEHKAEPVDDGHGHAH